MGETIQITSNGDDSVTLVACGITAHIKAATWSQANAAAHALGAHLTARAEIGQVIRTANYIKAVAKDVQEHLELADRKMLDMLGALPSEGE